MSAVRRDANGRAWAWKRPNPDFRAAALIRCVGQPLAIMRETTVALGKWCLQPATILPVGQLEQMELAQLLKQDHSTVKRPIPRHGWVLIRNHPLRCRPASVCRNREHLFRIPARGEHDALAVRRP